MPKRFRHHAVNSDHELSTLDSRLTNHSSASVANVERLADWSGMAAGAFSANTIRAWRADWEVFTMSCRAFRLESLPAAPKTVRAFVFECLVKGKKPATVRRMGRNSTARQKQARGLTWGED